MIRRMAAGLVVSCSIVVSAPCEADPSAEASPSRPEATLRMATLAPQHSPWGKVFSAWARAVDKRTAGKVRVQWTWNGAAGPENAVVGKIRTGQLAGAIVTGFGLSSIHKPIVALQMPGAFKTWAELDRVRSSFQGEFDRAMKGEGFYVAGWGDVGIGRWMSQGFQVVRPDDLKGRSPALFAQDVMSPKVIEAIGGIRATPAEVMEILPLLTSRAVNVIASGALAAEQLQWASRLDHANDGVVAFGIGAAVFSEKELARLSPDAREVVERTYRAAATALTTDIRREDDAAFVRLGKKLKIHHQTEAERAEWDRIFRKACQRSKAAFPGDVVARLGFC